MQTTNDKAYYSGFYVSRKQKIAFTVFWVFYFSNMAVCAILLYLLSK